MPQKFGCIAAIDTFTVEVLTFSGLVRYHVLFVIEIATRRVEIAGMGLTRPGAARRAPRRQQSQQNEQILPGLTEGAEARSGLAPRPNPIQRYGRAQ